MRCPFCGEGSQTATTEAHDGMFYCVLACGCGATMTSLSDTEDGAVDEAYRKWEARDQSVPMSHVAAMIPFLGDDPSEYDRGRFDAMVGMVGDMFGMDDESVVSMALMMAGM